MLANVIWSFGPDGNMFKTTILENGALDLTLNPYRFWMSLVNYGVIICMVVNSFNGHAKATTIWVCLAAITLLHEYTIFGLCVLAFVLYPFVKRWMSAKFVQAVKSATAAAPGITPPNE
jgi:hypothetical protein